MPNASSAQGGYRNVTTSALRVLENYDWPGNVRELRQIVERAFALSGRLELGHEEIVAALNHGGVASSRANHNGSERQQLLNLLESCNWDTALAADYLGVHRVTIYRRMRRLGLNRPATNSYAHANAAFPFAP